MQVLRGYQKDKSTTAVVRLSKQPLSNLPPDIQGTLEDNSKKNCYLIGEGYRRLIFKKLIYEIDKVAKRQPQNNHRQ